MDDHSFSHLPTLSDAEKLINDLSHLTAEQIGLAGEYALLPIRSSFITARTREEQENTIRTLLHVLPRIRLYKWKTLYELLIFVDSYIEIEAKKESADEEWRTLLLGSISALFEQAEESVHTALFSSDQTGLLAHVIQSSISFLSAESRMLLLVARVIESILPRSPDSNASKRFLSFLPGISVAYHKLVVQPSSTRCSAAVICKWISIWRRVLDVAFSSDPENLPVGEVLSKEASDIVGNLFSKSLRRFQNHASESVQLEIIVLCGDMCSRGSSFKRSFPGLVDCLLALSSDPKPAIAESALQCINKSSCALRRYGELDLTEHVEERLFSLVKNLPDRLSAADFDDALLSDMRCLSTCFRLLGPRLECVWEMPRYGNYIIECLIALASVDPSRLSFIMEVDVGEEAPVGDPFDMSSCLRHLQGEKWKLLQGICALIGESCDLRLVFNALNNVVTSRRPACDRASALMLIAELVRFAKTSPMEYNIVGALDACVDTDLWQACTSASGYGISRAAESIAVAALDTSAAHSSGTDEESNLRKLKETILFQLAVMNFIACTSKACTADQRQRVVIRRALPLLIGKIYDELGIVSRTAKRCIALIALDSAPASIGGMAAAAAATTARLIDENCDYLFDCFARQLRYVRLFPKCVSCVKVIVELGGRECLESGHVWPLLDYVLDNVDDLHGVSISDDEVVVVVVAFLDILHGVTRSIASAYDAELFASHESNSTVDEQLPSDSLDSPDDRFDTVVDRLKFRDSLIDAFLQASRSEAADEMSISTARRASLVSTRRNFHAEEGTEAKEENSDDAYVREKPAFVEALESIISRCSSLAFSRQATVSTLAIDIMRRGLDALRQQSEVLLPLADRCWRPLAEILTSTSDRRGGGGATPNAYVRRSAFAALSTLTLHCGELLQARFKRELFKPLLAYLAAQASTSGQPASQHIYSVSQDYLLQRDVLRHLPRLFGDSVALNDVDCHRLLDIAMRYVDARQPTVFVDAALVLLHSLALSSHLELVWLYLVHRAATADYRLRLRRQDCREEVMVIAADVRSRPDRT